MKDLMQCRKLEAKFRQLAVSDPTKRFIWLAEAELTNHCTAAKRSDVPEADICNPKSRLCEHLVGAAEQRERNCKAKFFATCRTGKSSGFSPFSTRPTMSPT